MNHYFTKNLDDEIKLNLINYYLNNREYKFYTSNGVFSKKRIDFGTDLLLKSLIKKEISGNVLDMCCGYGVIGIVIKDHFKNIDLDMIDINNRALDLTKKNLELNNIEGCIFSSNIFDDIDSNKLYTNVILNPPIRTGKENIFKIYNEIYKRLEINGRLYLVIQKKQGAPSSINELNTYFKNVEVINKKDGYYIIECLK